MSEEVIKILDALAEKFGLAIDWTSANVLPYLQQLCGKYVTYEIGKGCGERWANGELVNYNSGYNSGNVILYNHDRQVIYHIPYKGIKWLLPCKSKSK